MMPQVELDQLRWVRGLGLGGFGAVALVEHSPTSTPYALKTFGKRQAVQRGWLTQARGEAASLAAPHSPLPTPRFPLSGTRAQRRRRTSRGGCPLRSDLDLIPISRPISWQVAREKSLLQQCSHPFVLRCVASLQDEDALHLLLEFCPGGELLQLLQQRKLGVLEGA